MLEFQVGSGVSHICKHTQNRKSFDFSKSEQIMIFCEVKSSNFFREMAYFEEFMLINAPVFVQRRK